MVDKKIGDTKRDNSVFVDEEIAEEPLASQAPPPSAADDEKKKKQASRSSSNTNYQSQALSTQQEQDTDSFRLLRLAKNLALAPSGQYGGEEEEGITSTSSGAVARASTTSTTTQQSTESRPGAERVTEPFPSTSGRSLGTVVIGGAEEEDSTSSGAFARASTTTQHSTESRPGAERVTGPFPSDSGRSLGTVIIGGDDDAEEDDDPTALTNDSTTVAGTIVQAELVRDKTVEAVPLSEDVTEQGYQELQKDYRVLRKRVLIGVVILVISGIVAGIVVGTSTRRGNKDNSSSSSGGVDSPPPPSQCLVDLDVTCSVDGLASCNDIPTGCTSPPVTLVFTYNGQKCSDSFHNQRSSSFTCIDVTNDEDGAQQALLSSDAYIVATDVATNQIYRQGPIALNGIFWASNFQSQLGEVMNITVYGSRDQDTILQTLVYQSDCSQDLSLSNRFGALTLTRLITEEQGIVESDNGMVNVTYTYTVVNSGSENVTIASLTPTLGDFVVPVDGTVLAPGSSRKFQQTLPIDVTSRQLYTLNATVAAAAAASTQGGNSAEEACTSFDVDEFEAGLLPPSQSPTSMPVVPPISVAPSTQPTPPQPTPPPTVFPTGAPSLGFDPQPPVPPAPVGAPIGDLITLAPLGLFPQPTTAPPPTAELCMMVVDIQVDCMVGTNTDCSSIPPLEQTQCHERPIAMGFRYLGGDCALSSTDQLDCTDVNRDGPDDVYLVAFDVASGTVYESRMIAYAEEFSVQDFGNNEGDILNVTTYTSSDISAENMIQTVQFDRSCGSNAPLSLGDRLGASQLTVFVNNQQGVVTSVVEATLSISVSSDSPATVKSLTSSLPNSAPVELVGLLDTASIGPEMIAQVEQRARVDLSFEGFVYSNLFEVYVQTRDGLFCSATSPFNFQVPGVEP